MLRYLAQLRIPRWLLFFGRLSLCRTHKIQIQTRIRSVESDHRCQLPRRGVLPLSHDSRQCPHRAPILSRMRGAKRASVERRRVKTSVAFTCMSFSGSFYIRARTYRFSFYLQLLRDFSLTFRTKLTIDLVFFSHKLTNFRFPAAFAVNYRVKYNIIFCINTKKFINEHKFCNWQRVISHRLRLHTLQLPERRFIQTL